MRFQFNIVKSLLPALLACCAVALPGCGNSGQFETARVSGTVTLDGRPVQGGHVSFIPEQGRAANGLIDAQGVFDI
jgi:hypothetical protein